MGWLDKKGWDECKDLGCVCIVKRFIYILFFKFDNILWVIVFGVIEV